MSNCGEVPFTWGEHVSYGRESCKCVHAWGLGLGGHWGGGCCLKLVNSSVRVNRASNNPGSPAWLLREYKGHHKSTSSLTYMEYRASVYLGKLLFAITAHICLSGNSVQTSGLCCEKYQVH